MQQWGGWFQGPRLLSIKVSLDVIEADQIKIKRFAENENEKDPVQRWHRLSRLLDGKRIMCRIDKLLELNRVKLESERGVSGYIAKHKLIDPALIKWLESIYHSACVS